MKFLVVLSVILMSFPYFQLSANPKENVNGVGPLLETEWGQGGLYQTFTPSITKSWDSEVWLGQAYLGCTTVATAQVLKYYGYQNIKYLERFQEYSNCYSLGNHERSGLKGEDVDKNGVLCIKGVDKGFDFSSLVSKLPDVSIDKNGDGKMDKGIFKKFPSNKRKGYQKTAKFLYKISAMVNAEYGGKTGAAAHPNFLERLFEQHFGYASDGSLSKRKNLKMVFKDISGYRISDKDWIKLLVNELKNGRPIIYSGYRKDESSGHTFVVDGYKVEKGKTLFHVNWGWGGTANGYYDILELKDHKKRTWSTNPYAYIGLEPFKGAGLKKLNQKK